MIDREVHLRRVDQAYVNAMRELHHKDPEDDDAASLFAESMMNTMPWDYWLDPENPKPLTEEVLAALEGAEFASVLRGARWGYAAVNALHILGIALLVGAIVPLNLRLFGLWRGVPQGFLVRVLVPMAASGLGLTVIAGFLLFAVRAQEYAAIGFLQAKLLLVVVGTLAALEAHRRYGILLEGARRSYLTVHAGISTICWLGALLCGRLIGFAS